MTDEKATEPTLRARCEQRASFKLTQTPCAGGDRSRPTGSAQVTYLYWRHYNEQFEVLEQQVKAKWAAACRDARRSQNSINDSHKVTARL